MTTEHDAQQPVFRGQVSVLAGGQNSDGSPQGQQRSAGADSDPGRATAVSTRRQGSAAAQGSGSLSGPPVAAADPWPAWARPQLLAAAAVVEQLRSRDHRRPVATELYRRWYRPALGQTIDFGRSWRPLVGTYRTAHAGSGTRILADGIALVDRHDAVGRDGWWRTWGDAWAPVESRRHSVRVLLSPHPSTLAEFVATLTAALLDSAEPWLLACTTDLRRLRRSGSAVLYVPGASALPAGLLDLLRPLLRAVTPPLCLPLAPGAALAEYQDTGTSFGAHRCHLVARAMTLPAARHAPLEAIAGVFASHGIDPATPHRSPRG